MMGIATIRKLLSLAAMGAVAAGCGDAPTFPAAPEARLDVLVASPPPLEIYGGCVSRGTRYDSSGYYSTGYYFCDAEASGGSGTGYSFTWYGAAERTDSGGYSSAYVTCRIGYPVDVSVQVTDSSGGSQVATYRNLCSA